MTTLINELKSLQPVELDAGQVFSGKPSGTLVKGYAQPSAYTPAIDPSYIFHESILTLTFYIKSLYFLHEDSQRRDTHYCREGVLVRNGQQAAFI